MGGEQAGAREAEKQAGRQVRRSAVSAEVMEAEAREGMRGGQASR